jgi:HEPN domain-containing protein
MTKKEYIEFWLSGSEKNWKEVHVMVKSKLYVNALFWAHLVLEKLCKAHWVKDNKDNSPPRIHNLNKIIAQTKVELSDEELAFCADMNKFSLEGRYPDYVSNIYKIVTKPYTIKYIKQCEQIRKKLLSTLQ